ncbi:Short-chain dehydrogenase/reductase family 16C member 6-like protein [Leptotrombidium deliense]|uniref:Short-chain dehydrogenase/reductase 3 n=1 Tax=Leptotrombidium deliense TaxID=299467 RepID=A0A443SKF5_9ACAR|nr:Short-chain dehydrogenase/reductase family 16C member 6-like protein [Leptotrombidium deliense]
METLKYLLLFFYYCFLELIFLFVPKSWLLKNIEEEIVLITGAGRGLGKALAVKFSGLVKHVILWDIDESALKETAKLVKQRGGNATYYVVDVSNRRMVCETKNKVQSEVGTVSILVNSASISKGKYFQNLNDEDIAKTFEVNTYSMFWMHKAFLPEMMKENKGHCLLIGDASTFTSGGYNSDFMASKAAVAGFFESLVLELRDANYNGVHFTIACPFFKANKDSKKKKNGNKEKLYSVAEQIIDEMRQNREIVILPKSLYIYNTLTTMLPMKACYLFIILCCFPRSLLYKDIRKDRVLITGAGNGLGKSIALEMSKHVSQLILWDIDIEAVKETARLVKNDGGQCYYYEVDVSNIDNVFETAQKVKQEVGKVDILVNNAGVVCGKRLLDLSESEIKNTFNVNTFAHYWLYKAFLPEMIAENYGHIVTVTSVVSYLSGYQVSDYVSSKSASTALFEALSIELKQDGYSGINLTLVCPYWMNTRMFKGAESEFLNAVEPEYVAREIIKGIRSNQEIVFIPRVFKFLLSISSLMPLSSRYALFVALGYDSFMNSFQNRSS